MSGAIRLTRAEFRATSKKKISEWLRRGFNITVVEVRK